jgi:phage host-nuclease inhibitor protein Gam
MKAMKKSELASQAGVTVKTFMNWCRPYRDELTMMGLKPTAKMMPPHVVAFLAEKLCIDV